MRRQKPNNVLRFLWSLGRTVIRKTTYIKQNPTLVMTDRQSPTNRTALTIMTTKFKVTVYLTFKEASETSDNSLNFVISVQILQ